MRSSSWPALEVAKFFCVFFMIFIHGTFWLLSTEDEAMHTNNFVYPMVQTLAWIGLFPLLIPFLAGFSLRRHWEDYLVGGRLVGYPFSRMLQIALLLVGLSYAMNWLSWGWHDLEWDALQFIALSFVVLTGLLKAVPVWGVALAGVACLGLTPWLRAGMGESFISKVLVGTTDASAFWPFFPWFFTVAAGYVAADLRYRLPRRPYLVGLAVVGGLGVALGLGFGELTLSIRPTNIWGPAVFQPSLGFVLGLVAFGCGLLVLSHGVAELFELHPRGWVRCFSGGILWIYLLHTVVGVHLSSWVKAHVPLSVSAIGFPVFLLAFSWGVGWVALTLGGKRVRVKLRAPS